MSRAFLIVIDSVGIGGAPDAHEFFNGNKPDLGANPLGHIAQVCADGHADIGRKGGLNVPTLDGLGLGRAVKLASNLSAPGLYAKPTGAWGAATEVSRGKDTPSGHWELAGVPVPWEWHIFPDTNPAFPDDLIVEICEKAGTGGTLANCYASGTDVIEEHGFLVRSESIVLLSFSELVEVSDILDDFEGIRPVVNFKGTVQCFHS